MRQLLLSLCFVSACWLSLPAQSGCPGCVLNLPAGLPDDTLYLPALPDGENGVPYDQDISFRLPKTTTPVHAIDTTTPAGLPISKIEIVGIDDLPPGLSWEANQLVFETATQTDGCFKICGTPTTSDSFVMTVNLKATVFIFSQEASFPMRLYIAPKSSTNDGFSMTNVIGCGSTTVTFTNNIPSGGNTGFNYTWDFGDGTTYNGENPSAHTYAQPGLYEVDYHATIDTAGYRLVSAKVLGVSGCTDQAGLGQPDLYLFILNPAGSEVFNSSPYINNTNLPHTFMANLNLDPAGSYRLEVWDEDSGLEGSDDPCGTIYFNAQNDGDTLVSGSFRVVLQIEHPVEEVFTKDTVLVYPEPMTPVVTANVLSACAGSDTIVLESSFGGAGNQWWLNGETIDGAEDFLFMPEASGFYQVQVDNLYGCSAISDSVYVGFYPLPAPPVYGNDRNNLELADTLALPASYSLQWYLSAAPIAGATGFAHCATVNGEYSLVVTDLNTGCTSAYTIVVTINPDFNCTIGTDDPLVAETLNLFPNPAWNTVTVQLAEPLPENGRLLVWDVAGRLLQQLPAPAGADQIPADISALQAGMYFLELQAGAQRLSGQLVVLR
ncbi:MAG: T9SS type A sorting domain-containing protein [Saprospirales bacterium]|nr:T9SS type A sorting domain-containing protein [Saprospirales bacterium]